MLPLRCEETAKLLADAGKSPSNTIHCAILIALIAEMLLCAESGGIFRDDIVQRFAGNDSDRELNAEAMRLLRNAVCHPAATTEDDGEIAIVALSRYVEHNFRDETWGPGLHANPGRLGDRDVGFFALRLLNNLGWWQAEHWSVKLPDATPPWPASRSS